MWSMRPGVLKPISLAFFGRFRRERASLTVEPVPSRCSCSSSSSRMQSAIDLFFHAPAECAPIR